MSLNATINPDFGQVEADPVVLNLGVFETFFEERRPFFVEGSSVFRRPSPDIVSVDGPARLFHSRRIGRAPVRFPVPGELEEVSRPQSTTILAAAKASGKTASGASYAFLSALTGNEYAQVRSPDDADSSTDAFHVEPRTNYTVARVQQDVWDGSTVGGLFTAVNGRGFAPAYVGSVDGELKWADNAYRVFTRATASRTGAVGERTGGYEALGYFSKSSGSLGGQLYADARSPGFDVNDLGFMSRAGRTQAVAHVYAQIRNPWALARASGFNINAWRQANYDGYTLDQGVNFNTWHNMKNYWWLNAGVSRSFPAYDDLVTRGGPVMRRLGGAWWWANVGSDDRKAVTASFGASGVAKDGGHSHDARYWLNLRAKPAQNVQIEIGPSYRTETSFAQWVENIDSNGDGVDDRFVFGELDSEVFDVNLRLNIALTISLTVQGYIQSFVAAGEYGTFKEVTRPETYDFAPLDADILSSDPDFTRRSLRGNVVVRYEYLPGSALFVVWSQSRSESLDIAEPTFRPLRGVADSFGDDGEHTFLVKLRDYLNHGVVTSSHAKHGSR
jgi:hypothetical protein